MELQAFIRKLEELDRGNSSEEWTEGLDPRKKEEMQFHDADRNSTRIETLNEHDRREIYGNRKYYATAEASREYFEGWIRKMSPGKVFLDYACGNGLTAIKAAKAGAALAVGIDLSGISVRNARSEALRQDVGGGTYFLQADCEDTGLPEKSMDVIICSGMLHHLDLAKAYPELARILAPSGRILAFEALGYNPLIQAYRRLTPRMRTKWEAEHILTMREVKMAARYFDLGEVRFWHLTSPLAVALPFALPLLNGVDRVLTRVPGLRLMSWMITFELHAKSPSGSH
jgi:SAM-dependent methyltransferase